MSRPAPTARALGALVAMEVRMTLRRAENLLVMLVVPMAVLVFFASVEVAPLADRSPIGFLLPGTLALAVMATGLVNLGIATAYERANGVLKRLGGAPIGRSVVLASKIVTVGLLEVVQVALLVGVAAIGLSWRPEAPIEPWLVVAGLVLGTTTFAGLGLALAGALRAEAALATANGLFLVFLFLGGIVLPVDHLPGVLADVAAALPAGALSAVLRAGLGAGGPVAGPLVVLGVWSIGGIVAAARLFRWE